MAKYQVVIDLDVSTSDLETAYMEAERMVATGAAALGRPTPFLTVAAMVDPLPRTTHQFTVEVPCGPLKPRAAMKIVFSPSTRNGSLIVWDDDNMENTVATYPLTAKGLQWLVRGLMLWPLDLLDDMAREDELARRATERGVRK